MDLEGQKADSAEVFERIASKYELPSEAVVGFQFVPLEDSSDWRAFASDAEKKGYSVEWVPDDEETPEEDGYMEAKIVISDLSAESLWQHEEDLTILGATHDFAPDGWGFLIPLALRVTS